jgi:hypothetical protein
MVQDTRTRISRRWLAEESFYLCFGRNGANCSIGRIRRHFHAFYRSVPFRVALTATTMAVFTSRNARPQSSLNQMVRKNPSLFGVPFVLLMVAASFGLTTFTQTRYDLQDQKVKNVREFFFITRATRFTVYISGVQGTGIEIDQQQEEV